MIHYGSTIIHTCDKCHKPIAKWEVHMLIDRYYAPGKNHDKCSSNIDAHNKKIAEFCPKCMREIRSNYLKESEE